MPPQTSSMDTCCYHSATTTESSLKPRNTDNWNLTRARQPTYRKVVRALVVHIIVLASPSYHHEVALGAADPREVTILGLAGRCAASHLPRRPRRQWWKESAVTGDQWTEDGDRTAASVLGLGIGKGEARGERPNEDGGERMDCRRWLSFQGRVKESIRKYTTVQYACKWPRVAVKRTQWHPSNKRRIIMALGKFYE